LLIFALPRETRNPEFLRRPISLKNHRSVVRLLAVVCLSKIDCCGRQGDCCVKGCTAWHEVRLHRSIVHRIGRSSVRYDTGVISGALIFIKREFGLTTTAEEIVVSGVLLGATLGAIVGGKAADLFGRRRVLLLTAAIFGIGASSTFLLYAFASVASWLFAYYFVPETRGRTLEQIEAFWRARHGVHQAATRIS
jgi:Major Facilitator Superfamily